MDDLRCAVAGGEFAEADFVALPELDRFEEDFLLDDAEAVDAVEDWPALNGVGCVDAGGGTPGAAGAAGATVVGRVKAAAECFVVGGWDFAKVACLARISFVTAETDRALVGCILRDEEDAEDPEAGGCEVGCRE